ncbi:hypothetical protein VR44_34860 [Streptomyces katrae]|uniref:Uncharacterized protein n=1 Tax=Streptomyces katrae TaxID=68223 RepID=A0A0F4IT24_9ACTN|nr:hypothetical protein VR44_34860 [Streptomyces katrae]
MPTWALLLEQNIHRRHGSAWSVTVLGHVDGTREEALTALRERVDRFDPSVFYTVKRRRLYGDGDGFMLLVEGRFARAWHYRFKLAELLEDSAPPPPPPEPKPEPVERWQPPRPRSPKPPKPPQRPAPPREVDIPERPAWLGRDDLA